MVFVLVDGAFAQGGLPQERPGAFAAAGFAQNLGTQNRATGSGETVRLDHVIVARRDSELEPSKWIAAEHAKFLRYADEYARAYSVMFLAEYFAVNAEILRMSICHGNGVYIRVRRR